MLISMLITMCITCELMNNKHKCPTLPVDKNHKSQGFHSLFHRFFRKKDINLLILHQIRELWISKG